MRIPLSGLLMLLAISTQAQQGPPEVETTPLGGPLYMMSGRGGVLVASVGEDGVVLVDDQYAPMNPAIRAALEKITNKPLAYVINTHWHGDHTGGNELMAQAGAVIVAHDNVRQRMSTEQFTEFSQSTTPASPETALPVITFSENVTLHINGEAVRVFHVPHAHTDGDSIVHFPDSRVLHMGDAFWNGHYPRIDTDTGATVHGMMAAVRTGLGLCAEGTRVIAGHGGLSDCAGLESFLEMLETTTARIKALVDEGKTLEEIQAASPNADYDEIWGTWYIKPPDYAMFVYQSLGK